MSFSKLSLYSIIFLSGISLSNQITAMEEVTESIKQELLTLDKNIITLEKVLEPARQQMFRDREQLNICLEKRERTKTTTFTGAERYTVNCDDLQKAYGYTYDEQYEYNGRICGYRSTGKTVHLSKNFPLHNTLKNMLINRGSLGRYTGIIQSIKKDKRDHKQFQDDFTRGERVNDLVYLQLLQEKIQKNNQTIQDRNSCLANRS
jgi:hypothetical protein